MYTLRTLLLLLLLLLLLFVDGLLCSFLPARGLIHLDHENNTSRPYRRRRADTITLPSSSSSSSSLTPALNTLTTRTHLL
ncbi:hypothetical protein E2C01_003733 [Portunus trituberculatus]|uniref:Secreted peptide n=1 Tax=Portunus trituberculatus TaxID=210409 RepID=A0A5B7CQJ8_PORTR|nr:hypothetical protein [Portunus trituberculatus]